MRAATTLLLATFVVGACYPESPTPHLQLPTGPACDVRFAPRALHDGLGCGGGLLVDDVRVSWWELDSSGGASVHASGKCESDATLLSPRGYVEMARDGNDLFALDQTLWRLPDDGSGPVPMATGFVGPRRLLLEPGHDTALVAAEGFCGAFVGPECREEHGLLWRINRAGGVPVALISPDLSGAIDSLAIGPQGIVFTGEVGLDRGLFLMELGGGEFRHVAGTETLVELGQVAVDPADGQIFARDVSGVITIDDDGRARTILAAGTNGYVSSFVLDAHFVYAVFDDGHLARAWRTGGTTPTVLLEGSKVTSVGLDDAAIYAYDCADPGGRIVVFAR
jgi:hypothetical protein